MSPTQRSLAKWRAAGYLADVVERWIPIPNHPAGGKRRDLFGFADILAIHPDKPGVLFIQACSDNGGAVAERRAKLMENENVPLCLSAGHRVIIEGWGRRAAYRQDGERAKRDKVVDRVVELELEPE